MKYDCGEASKLKARPNSFLSWRAKLPRKQTPLRTAARLPWGRSVASGVCCPMCGTGTFCEGGQTPHAAPQPIHDHTTAVPTPQGVHVPWGSRSQPCVGLGLAGTAALLGGGLQALLPREPATAAWGCFFPFFPPPRGSLQPLLSHRGQSEAHGSTWPLTQAAGTQTRLAAPLPRALSHTDATNH